jgi:hypothetical protein
MFQWIFLTAVKGFSKDVLKHIGLSTALTGLGGKDDTDCLKAKKKH